MFPRCGTLLTLKSKNEYKQISRLFNVFSAQNKKKDDNTFKFQCEVLCEVLNCNILTAREIISKNSAITDFSSYNFYQNVKFIKSNMKLSDLVEHPYLLTLQPNLLQHRYFALKELGFNNVAPNYIFRYSCILKETPQELKRKGFPLEGEYRCDILNEYLIASGRGEVCNVLQCMYKDGSDFQKIRERMNSEFLAAKLDCSLGKASEMIHKFATLKVQSIFNTNLILDLLMNKLYFSLNKVYTSLHLLSVLDETVENFLSEFPEICGVDTLVLVHKVPQLIRHETDSIKKTEAILKDFSIKKEHLVCCPRVLLMSPQTLLKRLTVLCSTEEFSVMQSNKKFLWLIYYYNNLNTRLIKCRAENIPCTINMFTSSNKSFEKYLVYNNTRTCIRETNVYLADVFKADEKNVYSRLRHCSNLQLEACSALNCRKVIEFLLLSGVTKEQIYNGLEIVFYDVEEVKVFFNRLKTYPHCQPYEDWKTHYNFIQLLIYTIEVLKYRPIGVENNENDDEVMEYSNSA